ncbi:MAG TPA: MarR family transcriptional regulator [Dehalococcoidia bacterium]|nr:MarR family transcriptional regulator [Dehalococcoidia bacterium]
MNDDVFEPAVMAFFNANHMLNPLRVRYWESCGLTMPQLRLLFILRVEDNIPVSSLAEQMRVAPSTISGLTDRLVRENLIYRRDDPNDRRVVRICLTDEGRSAIDQIDAMSRAHLREVFSRMSEESLLQLTRLLEELLEAEAAVEAQQQLV